MVISFVYLVPVWLLLSSMAVLYHVNGYLQRACCLKKGAVNRRGVKSSKSPGQRSHCNFLSFLCSGFHPHSSQLRCPPLVYAPDKRRLLSVYGHFWANITWFFAFFLGLLDWIVLILVWIERYFSPAQVRWNVKTDDVTSNGRDVDPHWRLWVVQGLMG